MLVVGFASVLSASHLSAHHTADSNSIEACLALHTVGLDTAIPDPGEGQAARPGKVWKYELAAFILVIRPFIKPDSRAPPVFS